jgi:integrase
LATYRKHRTNKGKVRWTATVRRGTHHLSRTYDTKGPAEQWAILVEGAIGAATKAAPFVPEDWLRPDLVLQAGMRLQDLMAPDDDTPTPHHSWSLKRACREYREKVTPSKKGCKAETNRLLTWERHPTLAKKALDKLTSDDLQSHLDDRRAAGKAASTVNKEILLISALYKHAAKKWKLPLANPATAVEKPTQSPPRKRRLEDAHAGLASEEDLMRAAIAATPTKAQEMLDLFDLALETGMRLSEILDLRADQLRRVGGLRIFRRPDSKNDGARQVTLSTRAGAIAERRIGDRKLKGDAKLFTMKSHDVSGRWARARKRAGVEGFRWHDLRHEGISRMADKDLTIGELKEQSGQRTDRILIDYINAKPSNIARKLG